MRYGLAKNKLFLIVPVIILGVVSLLLFREPFLTGNMLFGSDTILHEYPHRTQSYRILREGLIPLWNPYMFCGLPLHASMQDGFFYPPNLLFAAMPVKEAINLKTWLHMWAGGWAMFFLLRTLGASRRAGLAAGMVHMLSTAQVSRIYAGHSGVQDMYLWAPLGAALLVLAVTRPHRRWFWLTSAAGILTCQLLAGHPQFFLLSAMAVVIIIMPLVLIGAGKRILHRFGTTVIITFVFFSLIALLTAVQLLPTAEFSRHSNRAGGVSKDYAESFDLPPENLWQFVAPGIMGDYFNGRYELPSPGAFTQANLRNLNYINPLIVRFSNSVQFSPGVLVPYWGKWYFWETCVYLGLLPLFLAPLSLLGARSRYSGWLLLTFVLCIGSSMASSLPLFRILYTIFPPIGLFRAPARLLYIAYILGSVLAGLGYDGLKQCARRRWKTKLRGLTAAIVLTAIVCLGYHAFIGSDKFRDLHTYQSIHEKQTIEAQGVGFPGSEEAAIRAQGAGKRLMLFAALSLVAGGLALAGGRFEKPGYIVLLLVLVTDLFSANCHFILSINPLQLHYPREVVEALSGLPGKGRVVTFVPGIPENMAMYFGLEHAGGNETMLVRYYTRLANLSQQRELDKPRSVFQLRRYSDLWKLLNITHCITPSNVKLGPPAFEPVLQGKRWSVFRYTRALPRYLMVSRTAGPMNDFAAAKLMQSPDFNPAELLVLAKEDDDGEEPVETTEVEVNFAVSDTKLPTPVVLKQEPTLVEVLTDSAVPAYLLALETWFPGWIATVDGEEAEIVRANIGCRAVKLPPGQHIVRFTYRPAPFAWGLLISMTTLVILLVTGLILLVKRMS